MKKGQKISEKHRLALSLSAKSRIGSKAPNWKGGKMLVGGYCYIYSPNHPYRTKEKYVVEHRIVMEKKLKRFLKPYEIVHHINGIKTDNRIENLVVCQCNGEHVSIHNKIRQRKPNGQFV